MVIYQQPSQQRFIPQGGYPQQRPNFQPAGQLASGERYLPAMPEMLQGGAAPVVAHVPQPAPQQAAPRFVQQTTPRGSKGTYLPAMPEMLQVASADFKPDQSGYIARGSRPDNLPATQTVASPAISIPDPEMMGLSRTISESKGRSTQIDWNTTRERLEALGATSYRLEKLGAKHFRFVCAVPDAKVPGRQQDFEVTACTEGEAMMQALESVQKWLDAGSH